MEKQNVVEEGEIGVLIREAEAALAAGCVGEWEKKRAEIERIQTHRREIIDGKVSSVDNVKK